MAAHEVRLHSFTQIVYGKGDYSLLLFGCPCADGTPSLRAILPHAAGHDEPLYEGLRRLDFDIELYSIRGPRYHNCRTERSGLVLEVEGLLITGLEFEERPEFDGFNLIAYDIRRAILPQDPASCCETFAERVSAA